MSEALLTHEAKLAKFQKIFGEKLTHRGKLFRPTVEFYNRFENDYELTESAKVIYKWLGYKPYKVSAAFSEGNDIRVSQDHIEIPKYYQDFPYQAAACLSLGILRQLIIFRLSYDEADDSFIEFASIESGLGIAILNGLHGKRSFFSLVNHSLHMRWSAHHDISLSDFSANEYANSLVDYAVMYRLPAEAWYPYISNEARALLPVKLKHAPHAHPITIRRHKRESTRWWTKLWLIATIAGVLFSLVGFLLSQFAPQPSPAAVQHGHILAILEDSVRICDKAVKEQQNNANLNDIFNDMSINETKSRCQSLRNKYNYYAGLYNQEIDK